MHHESQQYGDDPALPQEHNEEKSLISYRHQMGTRQVEVEQKSLFSH